MSTLSYCTLEDAFNNSTIKKKKKSRKSEYDRILQRGSDIDITNNDIDRPGAMPSNCTNMNEINALPFTYDTNNKYAKLREQTNLEEQKARDQVPNEIHNKKNEESMNFMKQIQTQILKLTEEVKNLKEKPPVVQEIQNNKVKEGFANYQSAFPRKSMTFNNDQFNELLLYVFTGIFILILIDYIYKLGKKSF